MENRLRTGKIDDADDVPVNWAADRAANARPCLDAFAKMLGCVDVNRFAGNKCGANAVCAGYSLAPRGADLQANIMSRIDSLPIAVDVEHDAVSIGNDHHRGG